MDFRTDLALERHELIKDKIPKGVEFEQYKSGETIFTKIRITHRHGAEALQKPEGTYITAELPSLILRSPLDEKTVEAIAKELRSLLPETGTVLVVGLGNTEITPDSIGPDSVSSVLATRHIGRELMKSTGLGELRSVSVFVPGVLGKTGVETAESIKGLAKTVKPSVIIAVDALAARRLSRLGNTIQMCDTGISPGSGVGNCRSAVNYDTTGVPVISIGIPTVVDAGTLVNDLTDGKGSISDESREMIITPREIDLVAERASKLIGLAVNKALQPHLSIDEIMMLTGN